MQWQFVQIEMNWCLQRKTCPWQNLRQNLVPLSLVWVLPRFSVIFVWSGWLLTLANPNWNELLFTKGNLPKPWTMSKLKAKNFVPLLWFEFCRAFPSFLSDPTLGNKFIQGNIGTLDTHFAENHPRHKSPIRLKSLKVVFKKYPPFQTNAGFKCCQYFRQTNGNCMHLHHYHQLRKHQCLANKFDSREYWDTWDNFVLLSESDLEK